MGSRTVSALMALALSLNATAALASEPAPAPFGNRDMEGQVDLSEAYLPEAVYVTSVAAKVAAGNVTGSFVIENTEETLVTGLQYRIELRGIEDEEGLPYGIDVVRASVALAPNESKKLLFATPLPNVPEGRYDMRVQLLTAKGRSLGWQDTPVVVTAENASADFVKLFHGTIGIAAYGDEVIPPLSGPNVDPSTSIDLRATAINDTDHAIRVTPVVEIFDFNAARVGVGSFAYSAVNVAAGETVELRMPVTTEASPGTYMAHVTLKDENGETISTIAQYRFVVKGEDADIVALRIEDMGTNAGDWAYGSVDIAGSADALTTTTALLRVQIRDDAGTVGSIDVPGIELTDAILSAKIRIPLERDLVGSPTVDASLLSRNNATFDHVTYAGTLSPAQLASITNNRSFLNWIGWHGMSRVAIFAFVAAALGYALFLVGSRMSISLDFTRTATAAFLLVAMLSANAGSAFAAGSGGIETLNPKHGSTVFAPLGNRPIIALFVNSPVHGQQNNFCNRQVQLSYRLEYGVCENEIAMARVIGRVTRNGGHISAYDIPGTQWETVHNRTYQSQFCGGAFCFQTDSFNGALDLSNVVDPGADTATLQLVAKWGKNIAMPDANFDRNDPFIALGWAHALNIHLQCTPPQLSVSKAVQSGSAIPGGDVVYAFSVTNSGQSNASNVVVNDFFLSGSTRYMPFQFVGSSGAQCTFDSGAMQTSCSVGTVAPGQTVNFTMTFRVPQNQPQLCGQTVRNRVEARPNNQSTGSASAEAQVNIVCPPTVGCIEVFKEGFDANNQRITTPLPGFQFTLDNQINATSDALGFARFDNVQPGTHTVTELAQSGWDNFLVTPANGRVVVQAGGNCAGVTFKNRQNPQDADLRIIKTGPASVVRFGNLTYRIEVKNLGPATATNVIVGDPVPAGTTYSSSNPSNLCQLQGTNVFCNIGTLTAGQEAVFELNFEVNPQTICTPGTIVNRASVLADQQDRTLTNNESQVTTPVTCPQPQVGCIDIFKEGFDAGGSRLSTVPPFKFVLDGSGSVFVHSNSAGNARFSNVPVGQHTVSEVTASGWTLFNTTPSSGIVQVQPGNACIGVVFKNRQQPQNADVSIVKAGPATAVRGGNITYSITVTNAGPAIAQNVVVDDQLPSGLANPVISGQGCTINNGIVRCVVGPMQPGEQRIITINLQVPAVANCQPGSVTNTSTVSAQNDNKTGNNVSSVTTQLQCPQPQQADLQISKSGPTSVVRGQNAGYTLIVKNNGPAASPNTIVGDPLPAGTTFVAAQSDNRCVLQGTTVFCNLGTMAVQQQISLQVTLNVTSQAQCQTGTVLNRGGVLGDLQDPNTTNNESTFTTQVTCPQPNTADVSVAKSGPTTVLRGSTITYNLVVSNAGPATASGVVLTDAVPSGLTFLSFTGQGTCTLTNGTVTCQIGAIPTSQTRTVSLTFSTAAATTPCQAGSVTNTGIVTTTTTDPTGGNNQSSTTTELTCPATQGKDVSIVKTGPSIVTRGNNFVYSLTVSNAGPATATGVVVTDVIPSGLTFVTASVECANVAGTVTCQAGAIPANQNRVFMITVSAPTIANCTLTSVTNTSTVTSAGADNNSANNTSSFTTQINCPNAQMGCIDVIKETFDTNGSLLTPVTQFVFSLDGTRTAVNGSDGRARFENVPVGTHTITETIPTGWTQQSVTPVGGNVNVLAGSCVTVSFKNRQTITTNTGWTITKTDHETEVDQGDSLEYEIRVRNLSSVRQTNVTITDTLPDEVDFQNASPNESSEHGRVIRWVNQTFEANEERIYRVEVDVDDDADGTLVNTAEVQNVSATDRTDVNDDDDHDNDIDIDLTKTASTSEVLPGGIIDYTVHVRNRGNDTIRNITVTDSLPADVIIIDDGDADSRSGRRLEWEIDRLDEDDTETFRYRVSVPTYMVAGQIIRNDVCVEADDLDDTECESVTVSVLGIIPRTGARTQQQNMHLTPIRKNDVPSDGSIPFLTLIALTGAATGVGIGFGRKMLFGI